MLVNFCCVIAAYSLIMVFIVIVALFVTPVECIHYIQKTFRLSHAFTLLCLVDAKT